ncbi:MAG: alpha/beta fold hydrolase [Myxococcota bacterium]|nr:alpha/beta fold hydrolase [Myxococcota bacterium]
MNPFFMGPERKRLYGLYHPPVLRGPGGKGVVLCNPLGSESSRAHRSFRILSDSLARSGWHVLRFDYRGTGDSAGDVDSVTLNDWVEDIGVAINELRAIAELKGVHLLGLRLGALLATAAGLRHADTQGLILWDPVDLRSQSVLGAQWTGQLDQPVPMDSGGAANVRDFEQMLLEIKKEPRESHSSWPHQALVLGSKLIPDRFRELIGQNLRRMAFEETDAPPPWLEESNFGAGPVSARAIQTISTWTGLAP